MHDPLDALPYEIWIWCITLAIDGRQVGPLELLAVSRRWEMLLLDTPSLWNQIYVQNGEDEIARISTFLHLSRKCSLHVDILTSAATRDSLHLIAKHISRVTTISIRPGPLDTVTALRMGEWKQATSHILTMLGNGLSASDVKHASCFGISLQENGLLYHCIVLMQFVMATMVNATDKQNYITSAGLPIMVNSGMWEEYIARCALIAHWCCSLLSISVTEYRQRITQASADQDANARIDSIYLFAKLASYGALHKSRWLYDIANVHIKRNTMVPSKSPSRHLLSCWRMMIFQFDWLLLMYSRRSPSIVRSSQATSETL
jgi:hypothetical protein